MHKNHRERIKKRFLIEGFENFEPHNLLELLLFYAIPQKDTNELAHALLQRFGSLEGVFEASVEELMSVPGIKEHSATLIRMIPAYARRYCNEKNPTDQNFFSIKEIGNYLLRYYRNIEQETTVLLLLDNKGNLIELVKIYEGPFHSPRIGMKEILDTVLRKPTSVAVLSHNHPSGVPLPTNSDILKTKAIEEALRMVDIRLLAHILVAGNAYLDILHPEQPLLSEQPHET
jgi:DNA repair protein RadC